MAMKLAMTDGEADHVCLGAKEKKGIINVANNLSNTGHIISFF